MNKWKLLWLRTKGRIRWLLSELLWGLFCRVAGSENLSSIPMPSDSNYAQYDDVQAVLQDKVGDWRDRAESADARATNYETLPDDELSSEERWDMGFQRGYAQAMNDAYMETSRVVETRLMVNRYLDRVS